MNKSPSRKEQTKADRSRMVPGRAIGSMLHLAPPDVLKRDERLSTTVSPWLSYVQYNTVLGEWNNEFCLMCQKLWPLRLNGVKIVCNKYVQAQP